MSTRVRKRNSWNSPSEIPDILFYWLKKVGAQDCRKEVHFDDVNV